MNKQKFAISLILVLSGFGSSLALARGGFRGGGGARVSASTSFRPGVGVTRSVTAVGGRYHQPATLPAYRPGIAAPGVAIRNPINTARRAAYRTAAGYSYYYGQALYSLPSPACYQVFWEGMTAYNCSGAIYVFDAGQYYSIVGA